MAERTLSELQVELFNRLRPTFYARLKNVAVAPSDYLPCGWRAEVVGDFTVAEHSEAVEIARDLQRRFSLRSDPLKGQAEPDLEEPNSDRSDIA